MIMPEEPQSVKREKAAILLISLVVAVIGVQSCSKKDGSKDVPKGAYKVQSGGMILGAVDTSSVTPSGQIHAEGWAVSNYSGVALVSVKVLVDGNAVGETKNIGDPPRPDVASCYGSPDLKDSGWKIDIPIGNLPSGHHVVTFRAYNANGDYLQLPGKALTIN